jgi:hypothetical protein
MAHDRISLRETVGSTRRNLTPNADYALLDRQLAIAAPRYHASSENGWTHISVSRSNSNSIRGKFDGNGS